MDRDISHHEPPSGLNSSLLTPSDATGAGWKPACYEHFSGLPSPPVAIVSQCRRLETQHSSLHWYNRVPSHSSSWVKLLIVLHLTDDGFSLKHSEYRIGSICSLKTSLLESKGHQLQEASVIHAKISSLFYCEKLNPRVRAMDKKKQNTTTSNLQSGSHLLYKPNISIRVESCDNAQVKDNC